MDSDFSSSWKSSNNSLLDYLEEDQDDKPVVPMLAIHEPETPREPMEFLSRSWSLSASEISKALAQKQKQLLGDKNPSSFPDVVIAPQLTGKIINSIHSRRTGSIGKWFHHHKEFSSNTVKKKDKVRMENAHIHSAISIAGLAAALAAVAAAGNSNGCSSKMDLALASATELLASHCVELAESSGADHDRVASVVRSAVDIQSPGDLMTLTAAAATALRGEAALKSRIPKETRKNASISPYDKGMADALLGSGHIAQIEEQSPPCAGELLQHTRKGQRGLLLQGLYCITDINGSSVILACQPNQVVVISGVLRWKHVSVYINKKSQVIMKIKSKHVGGAFSKKHKCIVYGVCDEITAWPYKKERESSEEVYFGVKTAQGLMEFKCKSKIHKQKWVDGIQQLVRRVTCVETAEQSLEFLSINNSI